MRRLKIGLLAGGLLAACTPSNEMSSQRVATQSAQAAQAVISRVPANASRIGAQSRQINAEGAIATYRGSQRDFVTCQAPPNTTVGDIRLGTRTTVVASAADVISTTIYVVTMEGAGGTNASITFGTGGQNRFSNGVTCRSTSQLEAALLGT